MKFGVFIPQGWKLELKSIEDPVAKWAKAVEIAQLAEELGYDSLWVYDHFHNVPKPAQEAMFECWTTMAAISQRTRKIMLGQMVGCNPYRNPALLAKITSNIDVMSGGRLIWGIGAGWYRNEFNGYGYEFASNGDRLRAMRETIEIVTGMWKEPSFSYQGRYYQLERGECDPKPVQTPRPQVLVGGGGEKVTLRIVARLADASNFGGKPNEWAAKAEILAGHCRDVGRDYDEIQKTWSPEIHIRETEKELVDGGSRSTWGEEFESWRAGNLVGTPEQVAEKIAAYQALGCTGFYPWCSDYPSTETMRLFAEKVIPQFR
ncbi:TIGR03560 family F420-dependent LLM class oxidoreductase [Sporichthya sp.]|uniref:TIGR03560 family F420-dependent LLM class oxidoreductase n=1 Tax=Sporichthya sp. TaxID=65475 RepID=UPI0017C4C0A9|nr:TIGR03560 family F420-dependent LLM class oxidoreductase [Sporichthya sp.]MBA3743092.1 TIGR03560 family F420-dependent LLM class oxidoreductase [Sporichthya sp.]